MKTRDSIWIVKKTDKQFNRIGLLVEAALVVKRMTTWLVLMTSPCRLMTSLAAQQLRRSSIAASSGKTGPL